jgi:hypothetical protein
LPREEFQYAVLRVVPSIQRGERLNVGVVLFSPRHRFLAARIEVDRERLAALAADAPADEIEAHLASLAAIAAGKPAGGPLSKLPQGERFHWLAAPASTVIQPSEVHTGFCEEPAVELDRLFGLLVG